MNRWTITSLALILSTFVTVASAQELPQLPGPEKEHHWLQQFVGEWQTESKAVMIPGQPAIESSGSISSRMIGGFWVINEMKGDLPGATVIGIQTIGYDPSKRKYVGTWVDSMVNHMWHYEGTVDETGKILTLQAEGPNMMLEGKLAKFEDQYEFKSANEIAISSRMLGDDGKWVTFMTGVAKRAN